MEDTYFDYANVTGRPTGAVVAALGRVLPGVAAVQRQVPGYARAWQAANLATLRGTARRWVVLGDSMSLGVGASTAFHGWVGQLHRRFAGPPNDLGNDLGVDLGVVNLAASGARVDDVLGQQLPAWRALPAAVHGPDIVTVLIGSNDLLGRGHRDALPAAFERLLEQLPAGSVVATMPQPRGAARAVNDHIERFRTTHRLGVVDLRASGPQSWRGKLAADHFHPNDAGYAGLADAFEPHLRAAVAQR